MSQVSGKTSGGDDGTAAGVCGVIAVTGPGGNEGGRVTLRSLFGPEVRNELVVGANVPLKGG
jgi:hypothetical protein